MSCRSHGSLSRLGVSQVRLVPKTGSEEAPTGAQQVPKWLEGTWWCYWFAHTNKYCSSEQQQQTVILPRSHLQREVKGQTLLQNNSPRARKDLVCCSGMFH